MERKKTFSNEYQLYIASSDWEIKRKEAVARAGNKCQVCAIQGNVLHVHHNTYKNLGNEPPEDLVVLCKSCHDLFHAHRDYWKEELYGRNKSQKIPRKVYSKRRRKGKRKKTTEPANPQLSKADRARARIRADHERNKQYRGLAASNYFTPENTRVRRATESS